MPRHSSPRTRALAALLAVAGLTLAVPATAWFTPGHARVARSAVYALPLAVPRFFREGAWAVGEASVDPDLFKDRTLGALRAAEEPLHYLDWELLPDGTVLPPDRWAYTAMVIEGKLDPQNVGLLPYSLLEGVQRLTIAFAEHRRYPENPYLQQKALVYAGWLAHYAGDLEQPLHTSKHHDGRANPDGSSPRTGIHQLVDGLLERVPLDPPALTRDLPVRAYPDPWTAILAEMTSSHALVDRVYELEADLRAAFPPAPAPGSAPVAAPTPRPPVSPAVVAFTSERYRATAAFLASLYVTAWEQSAKVELPRWHDRPRPPREGTRSRP